MKRSSAKLFLIASVAFGQVACGCIMGRSYGPENWRELVRVPPGARPPPPDEDGFYDGEVCDRLCWAGGGRSVERCYPVDVAVPVNPTRVVTCNLDPAGTKRVGLARARAESAPCDEKGELGSESCLEFCGRQDKLSSCKLEPDLPPLPADDRFVLCVYHKPGGCDLIPR